MKVIYIASPYTLGNTATNVRNQLDAAHRILDMGHSPIAPLLNHYLDIHRGRPEQDWIEADLALVRKSDALLRLQGESRGADAEVREAQGRMIPVFYSFSGLAEWLGGA